MLLVPSVRRVAGRGAVAHDRKSRCHLARIANPRSRDLGEPSQVPAGRPGAMGGVQRRVRGLAPAPRRCVRLGQPAEAFVSKILNALPGQTTEAPPTGF